MSMKTLVFNIESSKDVDLAVELIKKLNTPVEVISSPVAESNDPVVTYYEQKVEVPAEVKEISREEEEEELLIKQAAEEKAERAAAEAATRAKAEADKKARAAAKAEALKAKAAAEQARLEKEAEEKAEAEAMDAAKAEAETEAETEVIIKDGIQEGQGSGRLEFRDMVLTRSTFEVSIGGRVLPKITKQEFAILELLLKNPKQVFSKEDIFEYAWDEPYMGETKTLDVHISNIRKKIKTVTSDEYIETIWGIGYRLHE